MTYVLHNNQLLKMDEFQNGGGFNMQEGGLSQLLLFLNSRDLNDPNIKPESILGYRGIIGQSNLDLTSFRPETIAKIRAKDPIVVATLEKKMAAPATALIVPAAVATPFVASAPFAASATMPMIETMPFPTQQQATALITEHLKKQGFSNAEIEQYLHLTKKLNVKNAIVNSTIGQQDTVAAILGDFATLPNDVQTLTLLLLNRLYKETNSDKYSDYIELSKLIQKQNILDPEIAAIMNKYKELRSAVFQQGGALPPTTRLNNKLGSVEYYVSLQNLNANLKTNFNTVVKFIQDGNNIIINERYEY